MNLRNKKHLVARVLGVGANRVIFDSARLDEIKESLTRQDVKDLIKSRAIRLRETRGTKKKEKRTTKRGKGKIRKMVGVRKQEYMIMVRKLRQTLKNLRKAGTINRENYISLRQKVKARTFKTRAHLMEAIKAKQNSIK
jgi:large subunit ribosomal protein L19e